MENDAMEGVVTERIKLEEVNRHLLQKLDVLIAQAVDANEIASLSGALAKLNSSICSNNIFGSEPTLEELERQSTKAAVADVLGGRNEDSE